MDKIGGVSIGRSKRLVSLVFVPVIIIFVTLGCTSTSSLRRENRSYNEAVRQDTIEAYTEFIANNPDGAHVEDAKKRLVELEWEKAERVNTVEAYDSFIKKYSGYPSDSDYMGLAQRNLRKLNEQLALDKSGRKGASDKGEGTSKITLLKNLKSPKDREAKAKLVSADKSEYQKVYKKFLTKLTFIDKTKWTNVFVRGWQRIITFFKNISSSILNLRNVEIDRGQIAQVEE